MKKISVITVEATPEVIRGALSRWMIEPTVGAFVGELPHKVRNAVWDLITENMQTGRACFIYPDNNEQGISIKTHGDTKREISDFEGISLVTLL